MIYLDTSVLAAYYCPEPGSRDAEALVRSDPGPTISDLTQVELVSALARKVRSRELDRAAAIRMAAEFQRHVEQGLYRRLPLERRHFETARAWIAGFAVPLRTLDALHLALAAAEELPLATLDRALRRAAESIGVRLA